MDVLILADGDAPSRAELDLAWPGWDAGVGRVIAADGGARHAASLGVRVGLWVGDGDSIGDEALGALEASGVPVERSRRDKDESDTELAVRAALRDDPSRLILVGATGGPRLDHLLANVALLGLPDLVGRDVVLLDATAQVRLLQAPLPGGGRASRTLVGHAGDLVTLLPVGPGADGVTTDGLLYPLVDESLMDGTTRGLSNVVVREEASVSIRSGRLLVVESPATLRP